MVARPGLGFRPNARPPLRAPSPRGPGPAASASGAAAPGAGAPGGTGVFALARLLGVGDQRPRASPASAAALASALVGGGRQGAGGAAEAAAAAGGVAALASFLAQARGRQEEAQAPEAATQEDLADAALANLAAARAPPVAPAPAPAAAQQWQWSTGRAAFYAEREGRASRSRSRGSRGRERSREARERAPPRGSRSRSRGRGASRGRRSSRSRGRRGRQEEPRRARSLEIEGPNERGLHRASCSLRSGQGRVMPATGPWRRDPETAQADGEAMRRAFYKGGSSELTAVKNSLYSAAGGTAPPPAPAEVLAEARPGGQQWEVETQKDGTEFRALCRFAKKVFYDTENKRLLTYTGPWRLSREQAERDAIGVCDAFESGGAAEASKFKNELFKGAFNKKTNEAPPRPPTPRREDGEGGDKAEKTEGPHLEKSDRGCRSSAASEFIKSIFKSSDAAEEYDPEESEQAIADDRIEACKGGFRAACKFEMQRDTTWGSRKASDVIPIAGPARSTAAQAQADADELERAHREAGLPEVHRVKNELFKNAFKDKPDVATEKAHFNLSVASEGAGDEAGLSPRSEVVVDERGRGYRASCGLPNGGSGRHFDRSSIVPLVGPWRPARAEAEADEAALLAAFRSGGLEAAQQCKKDLRHSVLAAGGSAVAAATASEKLSGDEMAERYGKGYLLAQRMGYGGAGLGREEQGRDKIVSIDGARSSVGAGSRLGLGSGLGGLVVEAASDEEEAGQPPAAGLGFTSGGLLGGDEESQLHLMQVQEEYKEQQDDGNTDDEQGGQEERTRRPLPRPLHRLGPGFRPPPRSVPPRRPPPQHLAPPSPGLPGAGARPPRPAGLRFAGAGGGSPPPASRLPPLAAPARRPAAAPLPRGAGLPAAAAAALARSPQLALAMALAARRAAQGQGA